MSTHRVLIIIGGGIAAYKAPELIRAFKKNGIGARCLLTAAAAQFVSPLSLASVSGDKVYENLFDLKDEVEMGHIQLSREADAILVAPATADLIGKMAMGVANDLASTTLLATDKPVFIAPAMNVRMWHHPATQRNLSQLKADRIQMIGPDEGDMACGEFGLGRMSDIEQIVTQVMDGLNIEASDVAAKYTPVDQPLKGQHVLMTAGPTHEPIDPVRYIANRSSGKQGYAIATAFAEAGATVSLISGPTNLPDPVGVNITRVETAKEMLSIVQQSLPADIAVMTAAVADWRVDTQANQKVKKDIGAGPPTLSLVENPDILAWLSKLEGDKRPDLVIGFAAETENVAEYASAKRARKGCDWMVANNVSPETGIMGGDNNTIDIFTSDDHETWPNMSKIDVAQKLVARISHYVSAKSNKEPNS